MSKAISGSITGVFVIATVVGAITLHTLYMDGKVFAPKYPRFEVELNYWSASELTRLYKSLDCPANKEAKCKLISGHKKIAEDREWREALDEVYRKIRSN